MLYASKVRQETGIYVILKQNHVIDSKTKTLHMFMHYFFMHIIARRLFDYHDFRTSIISSPRSALSIYKDSCYLSPSPATKEEAESSSVVEEDKEDVDNNSNNHKYYGKEFLLSMIGMHHKQSIIEEIYARYIKPIYCLSRFCQCIKTLVDVNAVSVSDSDNNDISLLELLQKIQHQASHVVKDIDSASIANTYNEDYYDIIFFKLQEFCSLVPNQVSQLINEIVERDPRVRLSQLEKEYERIQALNSTVSFYLLFNAKKMLIINFTFLKGCKCKNAIIP